MHKAIIAGICGGIIVILSGCTVHPKGEDEERAAAIKEGKPFSEPATQRVVPELPSDPTPDDLVRYALLTSPELEQHYWEWRAAIEQIPQDGTQATNLVIGAGTAITRGNISRDRTTLTLGNDPMADIVLPSKLSAATQRALENARAAGLRFQKVKLDLRQKVLNACYDYALTSETIRLETANAALLKATRETLQSRIATGAGSQQNFLKAQDELDLSVNGIANMESQLRGQKAAIYAMLSLAPNATLLIPTQLPAPRALNMTDDEILTTAACRNPELRALAMEVRGQQDGVRLAALQRLPDFSLAAGTDLAGITQSLSGMATIPVLRHEAIDAAIAQAKARLNAADAMSRQAKNDLSALLLLDIAVFRDADRQLKLFERDIIPRASRLVALTRAGYETGQSSLLDLLESQRALLALDRLRATLHATREKQLIDIETTTMAVAPVGG
jgi:outer membrane protein, heavy metal efflux system